MSLKVLISNIYKWLCVRIRAAKTAQQPVQPLVRLVQKSKGGRKPLVLNVNEMWRMRFEGKSDAEIGRKFDVSPHTVATRLRDHKPPIPPTPPEPAQQPPVATQHVLALPVTPVEQAPVAVKQVPTLPPALHGSVPEGTKAFFLVRGELNAKYARSYNQIALGIDQWHDRYRDLPCFRDADRIWVVVTPGDDNREFILSLADDIWVRERCLISTGGVQFVCKHHLAMERARKYEHEVFDTQQFEAVHKFQPVPLASHTDKLESLLKSPKTEDRPSDLGGSFGDGYTGFTSTGSGASSAIPWTGKIEIPKDGGNNGNDGSGFCF